MIPTDPLSLSATEIAKAVREGDLDPLELAHFFAQRTENLSRELNSHIDFDKEFVLRETDKQLAYIEAARFANKNLPLAGVPIAIKDNIMVESSVIGCGSRFLRNHVSAYDATAIQRLKAAGALLFGRTNMDEFAMGSTTENSCNGPTLNPWNRKFVTGGSSGGSAAAVSASMVPLALGSDTGGSVRQPASFCGVVGFKPTYGRISRYGLVSYASSLDQIGTFARNISDTVLLYQVLEGHDPLDSTSSKFPKSDISSKLSLPYSLAGKKVAVLEQFLGDGLDDDVRSCLSGSINVFKELGAKVDICSLPVIEKSVAAYYILAMAEASSNLSRYDGIRFGVRIHKQGQNLRDLYIQSRSEGFGKEVKLRIMLGTYILSSGYYDEFYARANKVRESIKRKIIELFSNGYELILNPTSPTTAFEVGEKTLDSLSMYLGDIYTTAANLAGLPAISIPSGMSPRGLPIGMHLMAPPFCEENLLRSAKLYEQHVNGNQWQRPRI